MRQQQLPLRLIQRVRRWQRDGFGFSEGRFPTLQLKGDYV